MLGGVYAFAANLALRALLRPPPAMELPPAKRDAFDAMAARVLAGNGESLGWNLPYPLHEFTRYLVRNCPVLLHGTPREDVSALEPAGQTDYSGERVTAVFASDDGIWPLFFATIDRQRYPGPYSLRNAAMVVGQGPGERRWYLFSMSRGIRRADVFAEGALLILPRETFRPTSSGTVRFSEWVSETGVRPYAKLPVSPADFPFHRRISAHGEGEWFPLTWLLYRWRTR